MGKKKKKNDFISYFFRTRLLRSCSWRKKSICLILLISDCSININCVYYLRAGTVVAVQKITCPYSILFSRQERCRTKYSKLLNLFKIYFEYSLKVWRDICFETYSNLLLTVCKIMKYGPLFTLFTFIVSYDYQRCEKKALPRTASLEPLKPCWLPSVYSEGNIIFNHYKYSLTHKKKMAMVQVDRTKTTKIKTILN